MASVSIGKAWTETNAFVKREANLLFPVALLFVAIPAALLFQLVPPELRQRMITGGADAAAVSISAGVTFGIVLAMAIALIGGLALYALALRPGISVAEALQLALRRFPVLAGASLAVGFAVALPLLLLSAASPAFGAVAMLVAMSFVTVRLLPLNAVAADRRVGIFETLRTCWALTRGQFWRLAGFALIMVSVTMLGQVVAQMLLGLVGYLIGGISAGRAGADMGTAVVVGVAQIYTSVMIARIYRQMEA